MLFRSFNNRDADRKTLSTSGTVRIVAAQNNVRFVVNDEAGRAASRVDYYVEFTATYDTHGTADGSDDTSDLLEVTKVAGQLDHGSDFCDDAYAYTVA